jgi:excisionase family DNA binding protein
MTRRDEEVVKLREAGLTYAEIGRRFGISKERVRQILKGKPTQKHDLDSKVMLSTADVAQLLGFRPNTVRRWSKKGILKAYRIGPRGDRRFRREDVDSFLKEGEIE